MKTRLLTLGIATLAVTAFPTTRYVDVSSTNATSPFTNWITAATNIQQAVNAASAGDDILVTNGTYATGWESWVPINGLRVHQWTSLCL